MIKFEYTDPTKPETNFVLYIDNTMLGGNDHLVENTPEAQGRWFDHDFMTMNSQGILDLAPERVKCE